MTNEELVKQIQQGINPGDGMEQLYRQNDGYIRKIARRYAFMDDMDDLMQEAYFGLCEAVNHYEDTAGVVFMYYAAYWIKQSITRYLENNGRTVRIPVGLKNKSLKYKKVVTAYRTELGRIPSDRELCRHLGIGLKALEALRKAMYQYDNMQSLDEPIPGTDDGSILLGDGVPDHNVNIENDTINRIMDNHLHNELWQIVKVHTTPEENKVIRARYIQSMSLEATGQSIGQTRDRARNLEAKALRKLRHPSVRRKLEERFEVNYAKAYRGSVSSFKNTGTSITEYIALCNLELQGIN